MTGGGVSCFSSSLFFFFFFFFGALPFERPARPPNVPEYMIQQTTSPGKKLCSVLGCKVMVHECIPDLQINFFRCQMKTKVNPGIVQFTV